MFPLGQISFVKNSGDKKCHIVWETLDSEEATYIRHFEKTTDALRLP